MYCTECCTHIELCECPNDSNHVAEDYCENCGYIGDAENDFDRAGRCGEPECQEESEQYQDAIICIMVNSL